MSILLNLFCSGAAIAYGATNAFFYLNILRAFNFMTLLEDMKSLIGSLFRNLLSAGMLSCHDPRSSSSILYRIGPIDVLSCALVGVERKRKFDTKVTRLERVNVLFSAAAFEAYTLVVAYVAVATA